MGAAKKIHVRLKKSSIRSTKIQKANLLGLGLTKTHKKVVLEDTASTRGMIKKVIHLLEVKPHDGQEKKIEKKNQVEIKEGKAPVKKEKATAKAKVSKKTTAKAPQKKATKKTTKKVTKKTAKKAAKKK
ncbi:MAG: 50S ribosomal protein L30 [Bdellovibrionota bacterium]